MKVSHSSCCYAVRVRFYRATLCVSAVFAVYRCLSVSLSVRLSVTLVHSIQTSKDIVELLSRPGSPIILVFLTPSAGIQSLQRGGKIQGMGKFCDFRPKWPFISETTIDRAIVTIERQ